MHNKTLADVLLAYADRLNQGRQDQDDYLAMFPEHREELASLMNIAARVKMALRPVRPAQAFREVLQSNLLAAARQKVREPHLVIRNPLAHRRVLIGAAIGSAVSVAVGITAALLLHNKALNKSHSVPSA